MKTKDKKRSSLTECAFFKRPCSAIGKIKHFPNQMRCKLQLLRKALVLKNMVVEFIERIHNINITLNIKKITCYVKFYYFEIMTLRYDMLTGL